MEMEKKICPICKEEKDRLNSRNMCKKCYSKKYYEENRDYFKEHEKKYREENKEVIREYKKKWREENKDYVKEKDKKWREENRDYLKEYEKKYREENRDYIKEYSKIYSKYNSEKIKAHNIIKYAIQTGKIIKPTICEHCKKEFPIKDIDGHHPDYSKPLEVIWLCKSCHKILHVNLRVQSSPQNFPQLSD